MPGTFHKKRGGKVFPPDWNRIGYSDTPISTLNGFNYALDIKNNWDTSIVTHTERYKNDLELMYFPKNIDMSNLITIDRMFQASNIEYAELDISTTQTAQAVFTDCHNLRYAKVDNAGITPQLYNLNSFFLECHALEDFDFDFNYIQSDTTINKMFCNCWKLKEFSYDQTENSGNGYIKSATQAFENCYLMDELTFKDKYCENLGCYSLGKNTVNGCIVDVNIGADANESFANFKASKLAGDLTDNDITVFKCTNTQSMFEEADFIGRPGISIHNKTGNNINASYMFKNSTFEIVPPNDIFVYSIGNANGMFDGCKCNASTANRQLSVRGLKFENCTNMQLAFANTNFVKLPHIQDADFSNVTNFTNTFYNSPDLDNDTVNGILLALTTATSYSGTKTLAQLGFTAANYPAATIQSLSNYAAFTAAGWSIGY